MGRIDFNPRSREGSDGFCHDGFEVVKISIHAPAKGATDWFIKESYSIKISIHAPAKGATER